MMRHLIGGIAGIGLIVLVGCSGGQSAVEAKGVLMWEDGKPIAGASIRCVPKESGKQEAVGTSDTNGAFSLSTLSGKTGAPNGEYTVCVTQTAGAADTPAVSGQMSPEEMMKAMQVAKDKQKNQAKSEIPAMYGDPAKSPLTLKIDGGNSKIELKLKKM